jgi:hypothetical protein
MTRLILHKGNIVDIRAIKHPASDYYFLFNMYFFSDFMAVRYYP